MTAEITTDITASRSAGRRSTTHGRHRSRTAPWWSITHIPSDRTFAEQFLVAAVGGGGKFVWVVLALVGGVAIAPLVAVR